MDLRGFDGSRVGAAFEVNLLAQMGALDKTMFLYDKSTDMKAVEDALDDVPGAKYSSERLIDMDQHQDCVSVLKLLVAPNG